MAVICRWRKASSSSCSLNWILLETSSVHPRGGGYEVMSLEGRGRGETPRRQDAKNFNCQVFKYVEGLVIPHP